MSAVTASDCRILRLLQCRIKAVTASLSVINKSFKNEDTWCRILWYLRYRMRFSLESYSRGSGRGDILHISAWVGRSGNRNVAYLNRNGSKRNLNLNWYDNDWNDNCRFLAVGNSLCFPSFFRMGFIL